MNIASKKEVLNSGEPFRLRNWIKHRDDPDQRQAYDHAADYDALDGKWLDRALVYEHFGQNSMKGVISSIKWGYPRGSLPGGGWKAFSTAFRTHGFAAQIERIRMSAPADSVAVISALNALVSGVATATTSKIAYFAGLPSRDGGCLIYDSMVRRAIRDRDDPEFVELKSMMPSGERDMTPGQQEATYGLYLRNAHQMAARLNVDADQVEHFLFSWGRNVRPAQAA